MDIVLVPAHIFTTTDTAKVASGAFSISGKNILASLEFVIKLPLTKNVKAGNKSSIKRNPRSLFGDFKFF